MAVVVDGRPVELVAADAVQRQICEYGSYSTAGELLRSQGQGGAPRQKSRDLAKTVHNLHERAGAKPPPAGEQAQSAASRNCAFTVA
ncbi:MAG: hypothetical protein ACLR7U_09210 [Ruthenibacterium lactatiformans]